MTKKIMGINPDYADFDEIDFDVEDLIFEYEQGTVGFDELRDMVGSDTARTIQERVHGDADADSLFDDPTRF